ncbi:hypothetical protein ACIBI9_26930 [Nonomuraea sp. NPDC050451]|uniref:hypothetical protein n=1 Tax=Nonomuraea sp. NPDC050451 TaxID=3364364 RepID=UPI003794CE76
MDGLGIAWTEFTWQEDGIFLCRHADTEPSPSRKFTMLYADARGVQLVHQP